MKINGTDNELNVFTYLQMGFVYCPSEKMLKSGNISRPDIEKAKEYWEKARALGYENESIENSIDMLNEALSSEKDKDKKGNESMEIPRKRRREEPELWEELRKMDDDLYEYEKLLYNGVLRPNEMEASIQKMLNNINPLTLQLINSWTNDLGEIGEVVFKQHVRLTELKMKYPDNPDVLDLLEKNAKCFETLKSSMGVLENFAPMLQGL